MGRTKPLAFDPILEAQRQWTANGWGDVADGMAAVTSIMRAQQIYLSRIDTVLKPFGLTFARYELLMLLEFSRHGHLPMSKLGARLQIHPASVTSAVDRLERDGFVSRVAHPTDRRTILAEITEEGRSAAKQATGELNRTVFADPGLTKEQTAGLLAMLQGLRKAEGDF